MAQPRRNSLSKCFSYIVTQVEHLRLVVEIYAFPDFGQNKKCEYKAVNSTRLPIHLAKMGNMTPFR